MIGGQTERQSAFLKFSLPVLQVFYDNVTQTRMSVHFQNTKKLYGITVHNNLNMTKTPSNLKQNLNFKLYGGGNTKIYNSVEFQYSKHLGQQENTRRFEMSKHFMFCPNYAKQRRTILVKLPCSFIIYLDNLLFGN